MFTVKQSRTYPMEYSVTSAGSTAFKNAAAEGHQE